MEIYNLQELLKPNLIQRLLGKIPKENGMIEINNLFATHQEDVEKISLDNIIEIAEKYKIHLKKKYKANRLELFSKYLRHCIIDSKLEDSELNALKHVKDILFLSDKETQEILNAESEKLFSQHVKEAVSDGRLKEFEKQKLEKIKKDLLISEETVSKIYESNAKEILQNFIDGVISDGRLSPAEETEITEIAKSLNIDLDVDEKSKEVLDRYKLYWQIENGELPTIVSDISIQKSENLHFKVSVNWLEQRRVTKRVNYGGPIARIKIAKGLYYRMGSFSAQRVTEDVWQTIDSGQLYLTNKRLIFMGEKGNKTIQLSKVLDVTPYSNGVDIQKESGKSPFLEFNQNVDIFSMILVRLMDE